MKTRRDEIRDAILTDLYAYIDGDAENGPRHGVKVPTDAELEAAVDELLAETRELADPCGDCGRPTFYDYADEAYHHAVNPETGCFLIRAEGGL